MLRSWRCRLGFARVTTGHPEVQGPCSGVAQEARKHTHAACAARRAIACDSRFKSSARRHRSCGGAPHAAAHQSDTPAAWPHSRRIMGPVAVLSQLRAAEGAALGPAIRAVAALLGPADAEAGNSVTDTEWAAAVVTAVADRLDEPGAAAGEHGQPLLSLASRACGALRAQGGPARAGANPDTLQYSLIRKLVGRGAHAAALAQGWELHAALAAAAPHATSVGVAATPRSGGGGAGSQQAQQRAQQAAAARDSLLAGAVINLVVCTAEAGVPDPGACGVLGTAVAAFAQHLRCAERAARPDARALPCCQQQCACRYRSLR